MEKWRREMNERLGLAAEMARQGNNEAALNYAQAAANIAQNKGTSGAQQSTQAKVAEYGGGGGGGNYLGPGGEVKVIPGTELNPDGGTPIVPQGQVTPSSSGGGGGGSAPAPSPTPAANPWNTTVTYKEPVGVKQAEPDIIIDDELPISPERIFELNYEELSGMELLAVTRSDMIDGQDVVYTPIKNLSRLRERFNPNNIIAIPTTSATFFSKYPIDLILRGGKVPYFDNNGDLVVEIEDVFQDEQIEVQIDNNGTINRVDFYDYK